MMNDKLLLAMKAHRIGVEDAKTAFKQVIGYGYMASDEERAALLRVIDAIIILPSRLVTEVFDADIER